MVSFKPAFFSTNAIPHSDDPDSPDGHWIVSNIKANLATPVT